MRVDYYGTSVEKLENVNLALLEQITQTLYYQ